jgi:hypothetical protein
MGITPSYMIGTPGPSGFGSKSTAEDVTANMDLTSKTIIVTGSAISSSPCAHPFRMLLAIVGYVEEEP